MLIRVKRMLSGKSGQAMLEYAVILVLLLASLAALTLLRQTFAEYEGRTLETVGSDYP